MHSSTYFSYRWQRITQAGCQGSGESKKQRLAATGQGRCWARNVEEFRLVNVGPIFEGLEQVEVGEAGGGVFALVALPTTRRLRATI
jgi:hypothetical protein